MTSPARGLGSAPLGLAPYGYGMPAVAPIPGGAVYQDEQGITRGGRKLSREPATAGQYVYNSLGRAEGMPDVQQMMTLAVLTVRGSSIAKRLGSRFFEARYVTPNLQQEQEANVTEAFQDLVSKGLVTIDEVIVEPGNGMPTLTRIRATDLSTGLALDEIVT
jgi:hypothetical protein